MSCAGVDRCAVYADRQWLGRERKACDVVALARHLVGIQSQLPTTPGLAARARLADVGPDDVRHELEQTRRLVRTWTVRGTLHVVPAEDLPLFWQALRPEWEARWSKYLDNHVTRQQRADAAAACLQILARGPATRAELLAGAQEILGCRDEWVAYLFSSWGGVLKDLSYAGQVVYGPELEGEVRFVRTEDWVDMPELDMDPDEALAALLERYVTAYSPARLQDFVHWSGVTVKRAREALARLKGRVEVRDGWLVRAREDDQPPGDVGVVRLLPKFDPYPLAHKAKIYLDEAHYKAVFRQAADVSAVVLSRGRVIGTWRARGHRVTPELFAPVDGAVAIALEQELEALSAWLRQPVQTGQGRRSALRAGRTSRLEGAPPDQPDGCAS
ncbi:winged helix DNA-binding domain-containing protein [Symbiobacterium terraclitae]|uniref:winged helix DNA-binding domain-containing protein n=1 Tax=Symbiobacterium terraclitae TaxID=557451 RepID=UPI0035B53ACB